MNKMTTELARNFPGLRLMMSMYSWHRERSLLHSLAHPRDGQEILMNRRQLMQTASVATILPQLLSSACANEPSKGTQTMSSAPFKMGNKDMQNAQSGYEYLSIGELSRLIQQKKVSPTEIVKNCLNRTGSLCGSH